MHSGAGRITHLRMRPLAFGERSLTEPTVSLAELLTGRRAAVEGSIEVKLAGTVDDHDVRHLHWLAARLGDDVLDLAVVCTGPAAYRRPDGVAVVPLALLGPWSVG